jgi:hypothetical protein
MMQNFWWRNQQAKSKIDWMSCERMSYSKKQGEMGFQDLVLFNKAILAKQCWQLL